MAEYAFTRTLSCGTMSHTFSNSIGSFLAMLLLDVLDKMQHEATHLILVTLWLLPQSIIYQEERGHFNSSMATSTQLNAHTLHFLEKVR